MPCQIHADTQPSCKTKRRKRHFQTASPYPAPIIRRTNPISRWQRQKPIATLSKS
ncbi:hypothetical protein [Kingella potus]|uniref:hypothetical protein n=1 Tax=Kingella potus TaxID=265175 RepID=UPI003D2590E6